MATFKININSTSNVLKFQQLVDAITDAVSSNQLHEGDMLPSVSQLMKEGQVSRDTVFKAYAELKQRGIVRSVPNRGYFVAKNKSKVFLFLDTFKAYKEVVYGSFRNHLPKDITVGLNFHHYNIKVFETIIKESLGKYSKYIIMNFDHPKVPEIIGQIPDEDLLIIDWKIHSSPQHSFVAQDFGSPVYDCFVKNIGRIRQYREFIFFYPPFTYHPKDAITFFEKFCRGSKINYRIIYNPEEFIIKKGDLYFLVSDRTLARFLDQCHEKGYEPGQDVGVISYNETPTKKYIKNGITVISTDFEMMGQKAAAFVKSGGPMKITIPTTLKLRSSL